MNAYSSGFAFAGSCSASTTSQPSKPAPAERLEDRHEVDRAVAGHGEHAGLDRRLERPALGPRALDDVGADALEVDVRDPLGVGLRGRERIVAGEREMAGVQEQVHERRVGGRHQPVDLGPGHHARAHVVVVTEPHALAVGDLAEPVEAARERVPLRVVEDRAVREQGDRQRVDGAAELGHDEVRPAHRLDELELRVEVRERLLLHVVDREVGAHPRLGDAQAAQVERAP